MWKGSHNPILRDVLSMVIKSLTSPGMILHQNPPEIWLQKGPQVPPPPPFLKAPCWSKQLTFLPLGRWPYTSAPPGNGGSEENDPDSEEEVAELPRFYSNPMSTHQKTNVWLKSHQNCTGFGRWYVLLCLFQGRFSGLVFCRLVWGGVLLNRKGVPSASNHHI